MLKQKTLKDSFSLSGKGLHTGLNLTVTFNPAPENHGYKIQRTDVEGQPIIEAIADNVADTTRGTVLCKNNVKVSTVEHGMAALYALGIDNCLIQVDGPEFPILDGSAQYYVKEIERVGIEEQNAVKDFYIIKSKIEFRDEQTGSSTVASSRPHQRRRPGQRHRHLRASDAARELRQTGRCNGSSPHGCQPLGLHHAQAIGLA